MRGLRAARRGVTDVERRTTSGERHDVIDGQIPRVVGWPPVAGAPVPVLATPGPEHAGAEVLPCPHAVQGVVPAAGFDCRVCSVQRLPGRLVTTPQTVHGFTPESSTAWTARSIRLGCYALATMAVRTRREAVPGSRSEADPQVEVPARLGCRCGQLPQVPNEVPECPDGFGVGVAHPIGVDSPAGGQS